MLRKYFQKKGKFQKYNNILDASKWAKIFKKLAGLTVFSLENTQDNRVVSELSFVGLFFYIIWALIYFFCTYKAYNEDQTILRNIYRTKLKHYGDDFERIASLTYGIYALWKVPFDMGSKTYYIQEIADIDQAIERLGVSIDYSNSAYTSFISSVGQIAVGLARILSLWVTLASLETQMSVPLMLRVAMSDILALVNTSYCCLYLINLKERYKIINRLLTEIKERKSWDHTVFLRRKPMYIQNASLMKDQYVCQKIKACARIYSMLYKANHAANRMFGFALLLTMLFCILYIILYLFYLMEATASGLFHDMQRYIYFLIYVLWQIAYSVGVIFFNVYFADLAVQEATKTSYLAHQIINYDLSPSITAEAMKLSMQLLHQVPIFSACGMYKLDYVLILEGIRTVTTFLVILLQFVMG